MSFYNQVPVLKGIKKKKNPELNEGIHLSRFCLSTEETLLLYVALGFPSIRIHSFL